MSFSTKLSKNALFQLTETLQKMRNRAFSASTDWYVGTPFQFFEGYKLLGAEVVMTLFLSCRFDERRLCEYVQQIFKVQTKKFSDFRSAILSDKNKQKRYLKARLKTVQNDEDDYYQKQLFEVCSKD